MSLVNLMQNKTICLEFKEVTKLDKTVTLAALALKKSGVRSQNYRIRVVNLFGLKYFS